MGWIIETGRPIPLINEFAKTSVFTSWKNGLLEIRGEEVVPFAA